MLWSWPLGVITGTVTAGTLASTVAFGACKLDQNVQFAE